MAFDIADLRCILLAIEANDPDSLLDEKAKRKRGGTWWGAPITVLRPATQLLVHELQRTVPELERLHHVAGNDLRGESSVVVCSDRRVVVAQADREAMKLFRSFPLGALAVRGAGSFGVDETPDGAVLRYPRVWPGSTRELASSVLGVEPSSYLAELREREAHRPPSPEGWHPDPTGRHQLRWWNGIVWTDNVANDGAVLTDPLEAR